MKLLLFFIYLLIFEFFVLIWCVNGNQFDENSSCNMSIFLAVDGLNNIISFDPSSGISAPLQEGLLLSIPIALAVDQSTGDLFFSDVGLHNIYHLNYKQSPRAVFLKRLGNSSVVDGMAVDSTRKILFVTDFGYKIIARMNYDGFSYQEILNREDNLDEPRAILLDIENSKMYYTDYGAVPHISTANYDGTEVTTLINNNLIFPNGLAANFQDGKIYFCDAGTFTVESMNVDGSGRKVLINHRGLHFFGIDLFHDMLYLTTWRNQYFTVSHVLTLRVNETTASSIANFASGRFHGISVVCLPYMTTTDMPTTRSTQTETLTTTTVTSTPSTASTTVILTTTSTHTTTPSTTTVAATSPTTTTSNEADKVMISPKTHTTPGSNTNTPHTAIPHTAINGLTQQTIVIIAVSSILAVVIIAGIVAVAICLTKWRTTATNDYVNAAFTNAGMETEINHHYLTLKPFTKETQHDSRMEDDNIYDTIN